MIEPEANFGPKRHYSSEARFLHIMRKQLEENGWEIEVEPPRHGEPDFLLAKGALRYVVELKAAPDGKRARLLPSLSQAILQSRYQSRSGPALRPLAVVMAPRIEDPVADQLREFVLLHAPDVSLGVIDFEGLRRFWGQGLEGLNSDRPPEMSEKPYSGDESAGHLFSDLNQWLLKVLIGQRLSQDLIRVPQGDFRNASQLANAAGVSVMSAFRFLRQLENEGFLDASAKRVQIGNLERLLERWQAAIMKPRKEIAYRQIIRGGSDERLLQSIRAHQESINFSYGNQELNDEVQYHPKVRLCVGGFLAASLLGFEHVSGVPPLIYSERIGSELPKKLGLARIEDNRPADAFIRIPAFRESVFRAAVMRNGVPVSDILQVWLESSINPARGAEQAMLIRSRVLNPLFEENA
jgi:hypothetical protein